MLYFMICITLINKMQILCYTGVINTTVKKIYAGLSIL